MDYCTLIRRHIMRNERRLVIAMLCVVLLTVISAAMERLLVGRILMVTSLGLLIGLMAELVLARFMRLGLDTCGTPDTPCDNIACDDPANGGYCARWDARIDEDGGMFLRCRQCREYAP